MNKIFFTITAIATLFLVSCSNSNFKSPKEVYTPKETFEMLKGDVLLVDVREADEIAEQAYDVKNIITIPLDSIESKIALIPQNKQVILVCRSGNRSGKALTLLQNKGYTNAANMSGGIIAWSKEGLPTIEEETVAQTSCCAKPNAANCNPDGTCKIPVTANNGNKDHLEIFVFHGTRQCETCKSMKANTKTTLDKYFSKELKSGEIIFRIIDVDDSKNEKLAEKFEATGTALMVNNVKNGKDNITDWSDFGFDNASEKNTYAAGLKSKIETILK
jgi:rhodanese-related sulfurtransferase